MNLVELMEQITLEDCPVCGGPAVLTEEGGWAFEVECTDCGTHSAVSTYEKPEDQLEAAKRAAMTWNMGKVISSRVGD